MKKIILNILSKSKKTKLEKVGKESDRICENTLKNNSLILKSLNELGIYDFDKIINCDQYLIISSHDLKLLTRNYVISRNNWERILNARLIAVYIYDFFCNYEKLLNKHYYKELSIISDNTVIKKIKEINKSITEYRKLIKEKIDRIRHDTMAHKTRDGSKLYENINNINHQEIHKNGLKIMEFLTELHLIYNSIHEEIAENLKKRSTTQV